jgi:hypothetical protein
MHQVEFVDQALSLEQLQRSINRAAIDTGIQLSRPAQKLCRIQVFASRLHHAQYGAALLSHTNSAVREMSLQTAWHFSLG